MARSKTSPRTKDRATKRKPAKKAAKPKAAKPKPKAAKPKPAKPKPANKAAKRRPAAGRRKRRSTAQIAGSFAGFPVAGLQFLSELEMNNEREWFATNKHRYEADVLEPALSFIRAMRPKIAGISGSFVAMDRRVGGSLMRIHRDTRFSKDKTPYKTNVGIQFRHAVGKDVHAPGMYVHIEPNRAFVAVGMWHPERAALDGVRRAILERPGPWTKVRDDRKFRSTWRLEGDSLKRPPRGVDPDHPLLDDLRRKDHIAVADVSVADLTGTKLVNVVDGQFRRASAYLAFLCDAVGVPF